MTVVALEMGITTPATWMEEAYDIFAAVTHEAYATWKRQRDELRAPLPFLSVSSMPVNQATKPASVVSCNRSFVVSDGA